MHIKKLDLQNHSIIKDNHSFCNPKLKKIFIIRK
jgi:hypothetical protein